MKYILSIVSVALLLLCGCVEEEIKNNDANGWLSVDFLTDRSLVTKVEQANYKLIIAKPDGSAFATYENCTGISDRLYIPIGNYKVIASQGEAVPAGFDIPYYKAEQDIKIESAVTKSISLVCTQANVKLSVGYSAAIKNNFTDYSLKVINGNANLTFTKNEIRDGYITPAENTMKWELTLNNGQETYNLTKTITNVAPRQHYNFFFDIKEESDENDGAFVPGITVDTSTNIINSEYEIVIKDSITKPTILRSDNIPLTESYLVLNESRGANIALNVLAKASIQDMWLQHNSDAALALGVPKDIRFINLTTDEISQINNAGITWGSATILDAKELSLDFSALLNKLPLGEYGFKLMVFDARQHLTSATLKVNIIPDIDHIADEVNTPEVWAKFATIRGRWYTAVRPEGFGLEYSTDQVSWTGVTNIAFNDRDKTCSALIKDLVPGTTYYFRTVSTAYVSETNRQFNTESANQIQYMNFDNWYMDGKSPVVGENSNSIIWDSGNKGGAGFGYTPTTEEKATVISGSAVKMETQWAAVKLAAGNIYTGKFAGMSGLTNALLDFGTPYTGRPTTLSGHYKYIPKTVNRGNAGGMSGKQDSCHIYIALMSWQAPHRINSGDASTLVDLSTKNTSIIAFAELKESKVMTNYESFTLKLNYRDMSKQPSYILIVASSSKYGDYFTGGEGSTLWIDEFSLGFDPIE